MDRIDKLKLAEETLKEILEIYRNGFNKEAHPVTWRDLGKITTKIEMLLKVINS